MFDLTGMVDVHRDRSAKVTPKVARVVTKRNRLRNQDRKHAVYAVKHEGDMRPRYLVGKRGQLRHYQAAFFYATVTQAL